MRYRTFLRLRKIPVSSGLDFSERHGIAASAGYWLASQASTITLTPSGEVGSVGVLDIHADISGALANAGVKVTAVTAGPHKVERAPFTPLSDDANTRPRRTVSQRLNIRCEIQVLSVRGSKLQCRRLTAGLLRCLVLWTFENRAKGQFQGFRQCFLRSSSVASSCTSYVIGNRRPLRLKGMSPWVGSP